MSRANHVSERSFTFGVRGSQSALSECCAKHVLSIQADSEHRASLELREILMRDVGFRLEITRFCLKEDILFVDFMLRVSCRFMHSVRHAKNMLSALLVFYES